jgi:hypothetical protein
MSAEGKVNPEKIARQQERLKKDAERQEKRAAKQQELDVLNAKIAQLRKDARVVAKELDELG